MSAPSLSTATILWNRRIGMQGIGRLDTFLRGLMRNLGPVTVNQHKLPTSLISILLMLCTKISQNLQMRMLTLGLIKFNTTSSSTSTTSITTLQASSSFKKINPLIPSSTGSIGYFKSSNAKISKNNKNAKNKNSTNYTNSGPMTKNSSISINSSNTSAKTSTQPSKRTLQLMHGLPQK